MLEVEANVELGPGPGPWLPSLLLTASSVSLRLLSLKRRLSHPRASSSDTHQLSVIILLLARLHTASGALQLLLG